MHLFFSSFSSLLFPVLFLIVTGAFAEGKLAWNAEPRNYAPTQIVLGPANQSPIPPRIAQGATPISASQLSKPTGINAWEVQCSSHIDGFGCENAIDGSIATPWRTQKSDRGHHHIDIDLRQVHNITALRMAPHATAATEGGSISGLKIYLSSVKGDWSSPAVAYGTWFDDEKGQPGTRFKPHHVT